MKGHCLTKPPVSTVQYKFRGTLNKHIIPEYNVATCHAHSKVLSSKSSNGAVKKSSSDFFRLIALVTLRWEKFQQDILKFSFMHRKYENGAAGVKVVIFGPKSLGRQKSTIFPIRRRQWHLKPFFPPQISLLALREENVFFFKTL